MSLPDPAEHDRRRPVRLLLERGTGGERPRFVAPLIRLGRRGG